MDVPTIEAALRTVLPEAHVVGDKYPEYVFALDELAPAQGLTVVVIYRDCRDVVSSTLRKIRGDWRSMPLFIRKIDTPAKIARRWQHAVSAMKRQEHHVLALRYEDFVQEKREGLEALGEWTGVDPDDFDVSLIKTSSIGNYKEHLSAEAVRTVEEIAGPLMAELGYR